MLGMGDGIHQRAVVRKLLPDYDIYLETTWPVLFHDMPEVKLIRRHTNLRTQTKNAVREAGFFIENPPFIPLVKKVWYRPADVRRHGSVLGAMLGNLGLSKDGADFSFPLKQEWIDKAGKITNTKKPILIYRPLVERKEWGGCANRNPDIEAYDELFSSVRDDFFVISVADLIDGVEWIVSKPIKADLEFHKGELPVEILAALVSHAALTFNSPGFMSILSRAVGTPNICVFGGYENSRSFALGEGFYLGIDPENPCQCFSHTHSCDKRIDVYKAKKQIKEFLHDIAANRD